MKKKVSIGERSFTLFNNTFLILLALICIVPFLNIIATSFASTQEVVAKKFILFSYYLFFRRVSLHSFYADHF